MKPHSPEWLKTAIFYQIFPASFRDSNGDGIGDIEGIRQSLDYLQLLGVNSLWINPCFDSPFRDAGYDGRLIRDAESSGIRVCLDLVAPHTSIDHPWILESCKAEENKYSNWHLWSRNMYSSPHGRNGKTFDSLRGYAERIGAFATNFFWCQPKLNFGFADPDPHYPEQLSMDHPDVQALWAEMIDNIRYWLDMGCAGYRCDSAKSVCMGPGNEPGKHARFWCEVNQMLHEDYPDAVLCSEWGWPVDAVRAGFPVDLLLHNMKAYNVLFTPKGLPHGVERPFFSPEGGVAADFVKEYLFHYEPVRQTGGYIGMPTSNHDCTRIATHLSAEMMKCVFAFQMTMPGVPFVYYGEEIGMKHLATPSVEGGYGRTGARSPMQWSGEKNAGFSNANPERLYVPIDPDPDRPTVEQQLSDSGSLLNSLRNSITLRSALRAFDADAQFKVINAESSPFIYMRQKENHAAIVAINPTSRTVSIAAPMDYEWRDTESKLLGDGTCTVADKEIRIELGPTSFLIVPVTLYKEQLTVQSGAPAEVPLSK